MLIQNIIANLLTLSTINLDEWFVELMHLTTDLTKTTNDCSVMWFVNGGEDNVNVEVWFLSKEVRFEIDSWWNKENGENISFKIEKRG